MQRSLLAFLAFGIILCTHASEPQYAKRWTLGPRLANWTALLTKPSAFVAKSVTRLRKSPEGYSPSAACAKHVGLPYLDHIRQSRVGICGADNRGRQLLDASPPCDSKSGCRSAVDCYTAPFVPAGNASKAVVSLCRSHNVLLDSCAFLSGRRPEGSLSVRFPLPARGAVRLACDVADVAQLIRSDGKKDWLDSIHHDVWWSNATRDDEAVLAACAPGSPNLVTTPTLFVMRDRHANYAHEMEVVSMAFSFLAALEPQDVAEHGVQVVIVDQAPPTGFLETWARVSSPHRVRLLAHDPFPPGTCFRSAYHVYTFAAGIGYNTNAATTGCESPVVTGLSHWLRQLYHQSDPWARSLAAPPATASAAVAGPMAAFAGVHGLRVSAGNIVMKNVVWLSRRNLEVVRLLLDATASWKGMRLVRNEEQVVAGLLEAVQEWNAESCLIRRFNRAVKAEFEKALSSVGPIHLGAANVSEAAGRRSILQRVIGGRAPWRRRLLEASGAAALGGGSHIDEHMDDTDDEDDDGDDGDTYDDGYGDGYGDDGGPESGADGNGTSGADAELAYIIGPSTISLDKLWALDTANDAACRRTNVQFKLVEGDFSDLSYHEQLQTIFQTGVLAGVHGAGLAHGFFLPPGQSAVLQLLGDTYAQVTACNVFRNMAVGAGNFYEDVRYQGMNVDVAALKAAAKRAMDFVASKTMEAQRRRTGPLRLVLADQNHFTAVVPTKEKCPGADK